MTLDKNGKIVYTNIFDELRHNLNKKTVTFTYETKVTEKGVTTVKSNTVTCYLNPESVRVWCSSKGSNEKALDHATLETLSNTLEKGDNLTREVKDSIKGYYDDSLRKVYEKILKDTRKEKREKAFQSSGIIFEYDNDLKACCPKACTYKGYEFIVFKGLNKESICSLVRDDENLEKYEVVITTLVAEKNNNKRKGYKMNKAHTDATLTIDYSIMNKYFNGRSWSEIIELCSRVTRFSSISCPTSLKEWTDERLKEIAEAKKAEAEEKAKAEAEAKKAKKAEAEK